MDKCYDCYVVNDFGWLERISDDCNSDRRFIEKHWVESPETIKELMTTAAFNDSIESIRRGIPLSDIDRVAALFHARQSEVRKQNRLSRRKYIP